MLLGFFTGLLKGAIGKIAQVVIGGIKIIGKGVAALGRALIGGTSPVPDILPGLRAPIPIHEIELPREILQLRGSPRMRRKYNQIYQIKLWDSMAEKPVTWFLTEATDRVREWSDIFDDIENSIEGYASAQGFSLVGFAPTAIYERPK